MSEMRGGGNQMNIQRPPSRPSLNIPHRPVLTFMIFDLVGQEKIIRAYTEVIKNTARMKACIRPAMCKPYGKQYISFFHCDVYRCID